jgi:hypothetical protein
MVEEAVRDHASTLNSDDLGGVTGWDPMNFTVDDIRISSNGEWARATVTSSTPDGFDYLFRYILRSNHNNTWSAHAWSDGPLGCADDGVPDPRIDPVSRAEIETYC